jgi:hypothetical protein
MTSDRSKADPALPFGPRSDCVDRMDPAAEPASRTDKTAVPQYYGGQIRLLLPLALLNAAEG